MNHNRPPGNVSLPAVPESDASVQQVDEGEREAVQGEDVAQVTSVSGGGAGTGVLLLLWVKMSPSCLTVVPSVSSLVNMEPVLPGAQSLYLPPEEDSEGSLLQDQGASDVEISRGRQQLNN